MPKLYKILALFALFHLVHSHRPGSHRHNYGSSRFNQMADQSASAENNSNNSANNSFNNSSTATTTSNTMSNGDNYVKFTEFVHLNFSHSKQFSGLPQTSNPISGPSSSFDPFAALRQLLPALPSPPNWNSWAQLQSTNTRMTVGGNDPRQSQPFQLPNIVPVGNLPLGPNSQKQRGGFNNNYNHNFGGKNMERYGVDLSPHGNSAATTGFPGRKGFKESTTEKPSREDSFEKLAPNERLPNQKPTRPNRPNSSEKSGERPSLPQRNITAYWIF